MTLWLRGVPFEVHNDEALSNAIKRDNDFFEAEILDYLATHHKKQGTILDIGANIGNHTVFFAAFLNAQMIYALEPLEENFRVLANNIAPFSNCIAYQLAASAHSGEISMFLNRENYGASTIHLDGDRLVPCTTIDNMGFSNVTLMKIDVEEHEPAVLAGASKTIQRNQPLILMEDWYGKNKEYLPSNYTLLHGWDYDHTFLYGPK